MEATGVVISLVDLFEHPTIAALANYLSAQQRLPA